MTTFRTDTPTDIFDRIDIAESPTDADAVELRIPRRAAPARNKWMDRWGWHLPRVEGSWSTTRQSEILNLATTRRSDRHVGLMTGRNLMSNAAVILDPFALYGEEIENINVVVIGDIGKAKSSLLKTAACLRQLAAGRQVMVIDKKLQGGRGEYTPIAQALGVRTIPFRLGSDGARINLLDPAIATGGETGSAGPVPPGQEALLGAVLEDTMGRPLSTTEAASISLVLRHANERARAEGREAELMEVSRLLLDPTEDMFDVLGDRHRAAAGDWGRDPGLALRQLCEGDLRGLVDGETSPEVREAMRHPFVHFDVSALPTRGPALRVVMTTINTWHSNLLAAGSTQFKKSNTVQEEGWHMADGSTGRVSRERMKLSRGLGNATWSSFHHIADMAVDSPGRAMMQEAGIALLYGQARVDDAQETVQMYHLPDYCVGLLMSMGKGQCIVVRGGSDPVLMRHERSPLEIRLTDTDEVIRGTAEDLVFEEAIA